MDNATSHRRKNAKQKAKKKKSVSLTAIMFKSVEDAGGPFNNPGTSADNADNAETDSVNTETGSEKLPPSKLVTDSVERLRIEAPGLKHGERAKIKKLLQDDVLQQNDTSELAKRCKELLSATYPGSAWHVVCGPHPIHHDVECEDSLRFTMMRTERRCFVLAFRHSQSATPETICSSLDCDCFVHWVPLGLYLISLAMFGFYLYIGECDENFPEWSACGQTKVRVAYAALIVFLIAYGSRMVNKKFTKRNVHKT